jgi:hypothetical protein
MEKTTFKLDEVKAYAVEKLADLQVSRIIGAELHNEIFNTDYYIIGRYQAKEWLGDHVFEAIDLIKEYEQENFGQVSTDLSDPEKVVNMYVYILGEQMLSESKTLHSMNKWDETLTDDDLKAIALEIA